MKPLNAIWGHFHLEMVASLAFRVCSASTGKWTHFIKFMSIKPPAHQITNSILVPGSSYCLRSCPNEERPFEFVGILPSCSRPITAPPSGEGEPTQLRLQYLFTGFFFCCRSTSRPKPRAGNSAVSTRSNYAPTEKQ